MGTSSTAGRWGRAEVLDAVDEAAQWFAAVVARVAPGRWDEPGLGEWSVRELAGHTARALTTAAEYLADPPAATPVDDDPVGGAADYFLQVRDNPRLHEDVAERGRQAGAALGASAGSTPADEVEQLVGRVVGRLRAASAAAAFRSRFGELGFATYLATRVVELVVHTVDLQRACGQPPDIPAGAGSLAVAVVGELAVRRGSAAEVLEALGGRRPLPEGFGVFR